jgi:hypothetical protein
LTAQTTSGFVQRVSILDESHGAKPPPLQFRWRSLGAHRTHPPFAGYAHSIALFIQKSIVAFFKEKEKAIAYAEEHLSDSVVLVAHV